MPWADEMELEAAYAEASEHGSDGVLASEDGMQREDIEADAEDDGTEVRVSGWPKFAISIEMKDASKEWLEKVGL